MSYEFDEIQYICPRCQRRGLIKSVLISLTRIAVRGVCFDCGVGRSAAYDILEIDQWMAEDGPPPKAKILDDMDFEAMREALGIPKRKGKRTKKSREEILEENTINSDLQRMKSALEDTSKTIKSIESNPKTNE